MIGTKVIYTKFFPWGKFLAITLFGIVFIRNKRRLTPQVLNHELIHCQQQLEWLYLPFFILYIGEWLYYLAKHRNGHRAYHSISFEREAYAHDQDLSYLSRRRPFANYRKGR